MNNYLTKLRLVFFVITLMLSTIVFSRNQMPGKIKHVVLIGLDGWGAYSLPEADMPSVKKAMENGSYTLHARSVLPSSSAVNWASMFMGAGPELHGFTDWGSQKPDLLSRILTERYGMFPGIYGLIREQIPNAETAFFYEWEGMPYLIEKDAVSKIGRIIRDSITRHSKSENEIAVYLREKKPLFTMIIYDQPDGIGHKYGHDTREYYEELKELDKSIAYIMKAVKEAGIEQNTLFIFTADHGGINKGHGGKTMPEMEIPLIMYGNGVKKGYEITESVMIYDIAATLAYTFNLTTPQVWIGRPIKSVFKK